VLVNTRVDIFLKNNLPVFLYSKKQGFLFLSKTQKPHSELFLLHHAISPLSE